MPNSSTQRLFRISYATTHDPNETGLYSDPPFPAETDDRRIVAAVWTKDNVEVTWLIDADYNPAELRV